MMREYHKKIKTVILVISTIIVVASLTLLLIGYISSYIGYTGYDKHRQRRYSETIEESRKRNVLISELTFCEVESVYIDNVFIERGFKWGKQSSQQTNNLLLTDTLFSRNKPWLPFQLIVQFEKEQGDDIIRIPEFRTLLKEPEIKDTLQLKVYILNKNKNIRVDTLKIWRKTIKKYFIKTKTFNLHER